MNISLYQKLFKPNKAKLSVLIDPDKTDKQKTAEICQLVNKLKIDVILLGGSIVWSDIDAVAKEIRKQTNAPLLLFPGNPNQLTPEIDAILHLMLISGRNPDYLIHNHIIAAPFIHKYKLETIPTGYILIDGKSTTSVEYISNTRPIPASKTDIVLATALAGEQMGMKTIYLEAGSGAKNPVSTEIISRVKENISIPLIVGGGIKTADQLADAYSGGADMVVVGNILEKSPELLVEFAQVRNTF